MARKEELLLGPSWMQVGMVAWDRGERRGGRGEERRGEERRGEERREEKRREEKRREEKKGEERRGEGWAGFLKRAEQRSLCDKMRCEVFPQLGRRCVKHLSSC